jgi:hypothetical protein
MSKTKLAFLVFALAFGVNILSFMLSKKAYVIEEVKNIWLYELPLTASPLDAYVAEDLGPHHGIIGTLSHLKESDEWKPEGKGAGVLTLRLKPGLTFSNQEPILPEHWTQSFEWAKPYLTRWSADPYWAAYLNAQQQWASPSEVRFVLKGLPSDFDPQVFLKSILGHPMAGVFHPSNLKLKDPKKEWISSGPYRVRKWKAKEIVLVSRDDFAVTIPKEFFRTLKYQSAPVKNPACDFMQAQPGEEKTLDDHRISPVNQTLHVFWACRSWKTPGSFCANQQNRENFARVMASVEPVSGLSFSPATVRYRIPFGSDAFRNEIVQKISNNMKAAGGTVEEVSYFFKNSDAADIELMFVVTDSRISSEIAAKMAHYSSRFGSELASEPVHLVGEVARYPIQILMKHMKGEPFSKVFLEPDLEEKKLPL